LAKFSAAYAVDAVFLAEIIQVILYAIRGERQTRSQISHCDGGILGKYEQDGVFGFFW